MESKNFDESIGMADFDYAILNASSPDIANTSPSTTPLTESGCQIMPATAMSTKDVIINKLREAFTPESLAVKPSC